MWPFTRKEKALTGTSPVVDALRERQWSPYPLLGGGSRERIQDAYNTAKSANYAWMYTNSPAVRTVIDVIVRNVGQLDLRLYEEISEDERQPRPDHPAALSLRYPNEETSADQFIRAMFKDYLIFDDAYALLTRAPGEQLNLSWVPAHMVEIRGRSLFRAEAYRIWRLDGTWYDVLDPSRMLHWWGENPHDPRTGLSKLDTLRAVVAEDAALQQATIELANSGLTEPYAFVRPLEAPQWSNDARKAFDEDLNNRLRRRNRMPVVLEEGIQPVKLGVSPKDAEMMAVRRWAIERIAIAYGVPLGMVGLDNNLEEAREQFVPDVLAPYCEDFTKMLNHRILVRQYGWTDGCFEFNLDEKMMGDERIKTYISASGAPIYTRNESRAKLDLPPVDGGDELITPANVIVGSNPKPSVDVMPPQDPNKPSQEGDARDGDLPEVSRRSLPAVGKADEYEPVVHLAPSRKQDLDRQHRNIDLAQAAIERHLTRIGRQLEGMASKSSKASVGDWLRWDREFTEDLLALLNVIVEKEGTIYAFKLAGSFDMGRVVNRVAAMAEGAAEGINAKIREEIEDLGLEETLSRRAQHVASAGAGLGAGATRWVREEAARQSPLPESRVKVWIADTNRHAEFDGQTVALDADWPAGFAPGMAPGCRCSMAIH
jgi:HK97 family phage portal protein